MAADKNTELSITLRTVDKATAGVKAISDRIQKLNDRLDAKAKPYRDLSGALGELKTKLGALADKTGLSALTRGVKFVGGAVKDVLGGVLKLGGVLGGVAIGAAAELVHLVDEFDDLGKKSKRLGVSADFLASMRDAAERTGVPIEALDNGLEAFSANLGQARAGTGRMAKFLGIVSPALLKQLKAAHGNAEAFDLLADAMTKVQDPAKRAALAQKTLGNPALAELFVHGAKGIKEMREHYLQLAGPQEEAVQRSEEAHDALLDLKDSTDGLKASLVIGLAPALKEIAARTAKWLGGHREDIKQWAIDLGTKIPGAFQTIVGWVGKAVDALGGFYNKTKEIIDAVKYLAGQGAPGDADVKNAEQVFLDEANTSGADSERKAVEHARRVALANSDDDLMSNTQDYVNAQHFGGFAKYQDAARRFLANEDKFSTMGNPSGGLAQLDTQTRANALRLASGKAFDPNALLDALRVPDTITPGSIDDVLGGLQRIAQTPATPQQAKVTVDFKNAPRGTRVSTDPGGTADVDLNVGYNLLMGAL